MEDVDKILNEIKQKINKEIEKYIPRKEEPKILFDACWYFLEDGGKKLRPILLIFTCEAFGGTVEDAIPAATALELAHNFLLIHDDIEDSSDLRRGKPALHVKYGIPQAINVGDYLAFKSYDCLNNGVKIWGAERTLKILNLFNEMFMRTGEGQSMEIDVREKKLSEATIPWYMDMTAKKTGYYSGGMPCAIGALIAGADEKLVEIMKNFGISIGIAFQIQDDLLNISSEKKVGKEFGGDIEEGKRTLMFVHTYSKANDKDKKILEKLVGKKNIKLKEKKTVIEIFKKYGSIKFASGYASELVSKATDKVKDELPENEGKKKLLTLAEYFIKRKF